MLHSSRRGVLRAALAAGLASFGLAGCREELGQKSAQKGPRYYVTLLLSGGMDAICTTDPRDKSEVEADVDVPYLPHEIVSVGDIAMGPHLASLSPYAPRLAILNGVRVGTANHNSGFDQFDRLKTGALPGMPLVGPLLGARRDGPPLASLSFPEHLPVLEEVERAPGGERLVMAAALRKQRARLPQGSSARQTAASLDEGAALLEKMAAAPPCPIPARGAHNDEQSAASLARTLWAIENDIGAAFQVSFDRLHQPWDSHFDNLTRQSDISGRIFPLIASFLGELGKRSNARGPLVDQTLVVIGSELGRFPRLNAMGGKDHWPEVPMLFYGAGIRPGVYGRCDRTLQSLSVSLATGKDATTGGHPISLDDVGATLLRMAGHGDPAALGYDGAHLDFLVAS